MPAGLPGSTPVQNAANPSLGSPVIFDLISGPKGSPKDNDKDYYSGSGVANANASTGALCTGIGFGPNNVMGPMPASGVGPGNFHDDYTPGVTKPDGTAATDSTLMYIGGGRSNANVGGNAAVNPYTAGFGIGAAGSGGTRDQGAGPAYTGLPIKIVTATGTVANGAAVETGFSNRTGASIATGDNVFGVSTTASAAPAMVPGEEEAEPEQQDKPVEPEQPIEEPKPGKPEHPEHPEHPEKPEKAEPKGAHRK